MKTDADMRWYIVQTANGFERAVERSLEMLIKAQNLSGSTQAPQAALARHV